MITTPRDTVHCRFFAPIEQALRNVKSGRTCPEFSDEEYIESGIGRVLSEVQSGRDWVQRLQMQRNIQLSVGNFFQSLRSTRRLRHTQEVAENVRQQVDQGVLQTEDPLTQYPELNDYAVYASDGHYEKPSCHSDMPDEPAGYFFTMSLRSHSLSLLDIARPVRKREHDMTLLKRLGSTLLRMGEPTGTKVIHVYDPACINYAEWIRWKAKGVYIISREKINSTADIVGEPPWDRDDPRNTGVLSDQMIGVFCGLMIRRVRYRDPATQIEYSFITSECALPPGLIAFLYKLRWDIEKVFDEKKNKLQERKAWATTPVARAQQAHFVCLAHNLMILFERCLHAQEGICEQKLHDKRKARADHAEALMRRTGHTPNPLVQQCTRVTQRSLQFIRWLRHCLHGDTSYSESLLILRPLMTHYLS